MKHHIFTVAAIAISAFTVPANADIPPPNLDTHIPAPLPPKPPQPPVDTSIYENGKYCSLQFTEDGSCFILSNTDMDITGMTEEEFTNMMNIIAGYLDEAGENPLGTNFEACQAYLEECDKAVQNYLDSLKK